MSEAPKGAPIPPIGERSDARKVLEPHLVNLIAGLRRHQVEEAVALLLDYIDAQSSAARTQIQVVTVTTSQADHLAIPTVADAQAFEMFRTFVRTNAPALRLVASWGDGECGALHEVLRKELQGWAPSLAAMPLFPEEGGAP